MVNKRDNNCERHFERLHYSYRRHERRWQFAGSHRQRLRRGDESGGSIDGYGFGFGEHSYEFGYQRARAMAYV